MVPCFHQGNTYTKWKLRVWRDQKCIPLICAITPLNCEGRQNNPSRVRQYRAQNVKFGKLGRTYGHGTVFTPRKYLYQKEATGMERPEMYSVSRCNNPTYLCGPLKYPFSREAVYDQELKVAYIVTDLSPWYRVSTREIFIPKGSYGYGETRNVFRYSVL